MFQRNRFVSGLFGIFIGATLVGGLTGCSPTDEHIFNFQERLDRGIPITYDKVGQLSENCRNPWTEARMDEEWMENMVYFDSVVFTGAGDLNCYEIGSEVALTDKKGSVYSGPVKAYVDKVIIWKPKRYTDDLQNEITRYLSSSLNMKSEISSYFLKTSLDLLDSELRFSQKSEQKGGVIHSTFLRYVQNSAAPRLSQKATENVIARFEASKFEETMFDGDYLSGDCKKAYPDYRTTEATWNLINEGVTSTAWDVHSFSLCVQQGSVIDITVEGPSEEPGGKNPWISKGKIKIGKMRRMKIEALRPEYLKLNSISEEEAMTRIKDLYEEKSKTNTNPRLRLFLFDFEVVK